MMGQWSLTRKDVTIDDVVKVVQEFADVFQRGIDVATGAGAEHQHISIGLFELRGTGELFYIDPPIMQTLASLGLILVIDAYGQSTTGE
jgi:hypothetical protein